LAQGGAGAEWNNRARRRAHDPAHTGGQGSSLAGVQSDLQARDQSDSTRSVAPLAIAQGATYIDTTGLSVGETVERVMEIVREKLAQAG